MNERLQILLDAGVIDPEAVAIAADAQRELEARGYSPETLPALVLGVSCAVLAEVMFRVVRQRASMQASGPTRRQQVAHVVAGLPLRHRRIVVHAGIVGRWLLHAQDRAGDRIELTQEAFAGLLGVQRTTVNAVVRALQDEGMVAIGRGRLRVTDRAGLKRHACECYERLERHFDAVIGEDGSGGS